MNEKSCIGCKFLYSQGIGYSNYTWLDDEICCAKDHNQHLPMEKPSDWNIDNDNWPATSAARCELYAPGDFVTLDVNGEDGPADYIDDEEAITAICEHSGRARGGSTA